MTPWAAVVGRSVAHSLSPRIFRIFRTAMRRPLHYRALSITAERFEGTVKRAARGHWVGWNVTVPYKTTALALMDRVDASAREAGAVNVIHFIEGRCVGYNTDAEGFLAPLAGGRFRLGGKRAVVLGAGGAARAVCAALAREDVGDLRILNRTVEKSRELALAFKGTAAGWNPEEIRASVAAADVVVNATSLGMDGKSSPLPQGTKFKRDALAYDIVYRPKTTPFLRKAEESGAKTLGGRGMLVAQAAASWKIWFGESLPPDLVGRVEAELEAILE